MKAEVLELLHQAAGVVDDIDAVKGVVEALLPKVVDLLETLNLPTVANAAGGLVGSYVAGIAEELIEHGCPSDDAWCSASGLAMRQIGAGVSVAQLKKLKTNDT